MEWVYFHKGNEFMNTSREGSSITEKTNSVFLSLCRSIFHAEYVSRTFLYEYNPFFD